MPCSEGTKGPFGKGPFGKGTKTMWIKTQRSVSHPDFLCSPFAESPFGPFQLALCNSTSKPVAYGQFKISYLFLRPRLWQFENWDSRDKSTTCLFLGFETLNLKFCDLKLWKLTVRPISLLTLLDSNFPGNPLWTWEFHPFKLRVCLSRTLRNPYKRIFMYLSTSNVNICIHTYIQYILHWFLYIAHVMFFPHNVSRGIGRIRGTAERGNSLTVSFQNFIYKVLHSSISFWSCKL